MATIYEIAKIAGCSATTVSRALSGKATHNSAKTCERIRQIAAELGYRKSTFAAAVRSGRCGTIGFLRSSMQEHAQVPEGFRYALNAEVATAGKLLITGMVDEDELAQDRLPNLARDWSVDGLILFYTHGDWSGLGSRLEAMRLPTVWVNNKLPRNSIYPDDLAGGRLAAKALVDAGRRRLACFSLLGNGHYSEFDRLKGFTTLAKRAGCSTLDCTAKVDLPKAEWLQRADQMVSRAQGLDGIFCYGPTEVVALLLACARKGVKVPTDLSIVTIDWKPVCVAGIPITTLVMPYGDIIAPRAVDQLLKQVSGGSSFPSEAVRPKLVDGATLHA